MRIQFCLAFLVWSLLPHYGFLVHRHSGGEHGHFHASFSKSEIAEANAISETLEATPLSGEARPQSTCDQDRKTSSDAGAFPDDRILKHGENGGIRHGHTWSDANFESLSSLGECAARAAAPSPDAGGPYAAPELTPAFPSLARGPPAFLLS